MNRETQTLETRLLALERQNRMMRWGGLFLILVMAAMTLTGLAPKDRVIDAEAFTLLGPVGEPRAVLAMVESEPTLAFFDDKGNVRCGLHMVQNTPRFILYNEDGSTLWSAP